MSNKKTPSRLERAKSEVSHGRCSVDTLKHEFREKFFTRLRRSRSLSVDKLRRIVENYDDDVTYQSVAELRKILLSDPEASDSLKSEEVHDILNQIEMELKQAELEYEGDKYIQESQNETESIVNSLMNLCNVCDKQIDQFSICENCSRMFE